MKQNRFAILASIIVLATACACGKPMEAKIIPSGGSGGGEETLPVVGNYAKEILSLPATARDHWQIYQVNPKLYGNSGAFGKIQERLDDIKALGTDFFYLMPIYAEGKEKAR